jgi:hypothetical protein
MNPPWLPTVTIKLVTSCRKRSNRLLVLPWSSRLKSSAEFRLSIKQSCLPYLSLASIISIPAASSMQLRPSNSVFTICGMTDYILPYELKNTGAPRYLAALTFACQMGKRCCLTKLGDI